jgi:hypothetical protein
MKMFANINIFNKKSKTSPQESADIIVGPENVMENETDKISPEQTVNIPENQEKLEEEKILNEKRTEYAETYKNFDKQIKNKYKKLVGDNNIPVPKINSALGEARKYIVVGDAEILKKESALNRLPLDLQKRRSAFITELINVGLTGEIALEMYQAETTKVEYGQAKENYKEKFVSAKYKELTARYEKKFNKIRSEFNKQEEREITDALDLETKKPLYNKLVVDEYDALREAQTEDLPPKEKDRIDKLIDGWMKIPPEKRLLITAALATTVVGLAGVGWTAASLAKYGGMRITKGIAAILAGKGGGKGFEIVFEKFTLKKFEDKQREKLNKLMTEADFNDLQKTEKEYKNIKKEEDIRKRRKFIGKTITSLVFGAGTAIGLGMMERGAHTGGGGLNNEPSGSKLKIAEETVKKETVSAGAEKPAAADAIKEAIAKAAAVEKEKLLELAIIKKGDGVENALIRQLVKYPDEFGFSGDKTDAMALNEWAGKEAHQLAVKSGYVETTTGEEVRVGAKGIDRAAYALEKDKTGKLFIQEYLKDGETGKFDAIEYHDTTNETNEFEKGDEENYEYIEPKKIEVKFEKDINDLTESGHKLKIPEKKLNILETEEYDKFKSEAAETIVPKTETPEEIKITIDPNNANHKWMQYYNNNSDNFLNEDEIKYAAEKLDFEIKNAKDVLHDMTRGQGVITEDYLKENYGAHLNEIKTFESQRASLTEPLVKIHTAEIMKARADDLFVKGITPEDAECYKNIIQQNAEKLHDLTANRQINLIKLLDDYKNHDALKGFMKGYYNENLYEKVSAHPDGKGNLFIEFKLHKEPGTYDLVITDNGKIYVDGPTKFTSPFNNWNLKNPIDLNDNNLKEALEFINDGEVDENDVISDKNIAIEEMPADQINADQIEIETKQ